MRIPLLGFLIIVLNICVLPLSAQPDQPKSDPEKKLPKEVQKANAAYEAQQYTDAIELLKDALSEVRGRDDKSDIMFRLAECYRMTLDYKNAETYYEKAIKVGYKDAVAKLYQADMLKAQGEYEDAIVIYQEYKQENPTDNRGEIGMESTKKAKEWMEQPSRYQVDNMKDINSSSYDYAPAFSGKRKNENILIFTSDREESVGKKKDGWTGGDFHDLYISEAERKATRGRRGVPVETDVESPANMKWSTPVLLDEGVVNTEGNEGSSIFDSRDKEFYFTRCENEKYKTLECGIYVTEKLGTTWKTPERLIIGTDTLANVGQPSLSPDDKILYFVSDDFGAKGHDIFMTTYDRRTKTWANPKNLGSKVNTVGREHSPFAHDDGYLYFASNGLGGMGGLDVFRIKLGEDGMPAANATAENMQFPINTSGDDYGLIFKPGGDEVGFMTSNRKGSKSDDIYAVVKTPLVFNIEGVITSSKTGKSIDQVTVKLEGGGESFVVNTDKDGYYIFDKTKVKQDVTYKVTFEKQKFLTNAGDITTVGVTLSSFEYIPSENIFLHILRLNKSLDPIEDPIVLPNVFFDLAKARIREEAKVALDSVVTILNNNPTIVIELRSHTDYRGTDAANDDLSQRRADSSVAYLVTRGIPADRMVARGMGEREPYVIPENYRFYGKGQFEPGTKLTEKYILTLPPEKQEVANQINRRTDLKVLRDDYVPSGGLDKPKADDVKAILEDKRDGVNNEPPGEIYVMKDRESFGTVARDQRIGIVDIKQLNGGLRGVRPFEGLQLKITKDGNYEQWDATHYQVTKAGTTIKDIAKELDLDDDAIEKMNPDVDAKNLPLGYWVKTK